MKEINELRKRIGILDKILDSGISQQRERQIYEELTEAKEELANREKEILQYLHRKDLSNIWDLNLLELETLSKLIIKYQSDLKGFAVFDATQEAKVELVLLKLKTLALTETEKLINQIYKKLHPGAYKDK